jgi:Fe-Mn family superoxide dismutase
MADTSRRSFLQAAATGVVAANLVTAATAADAPAPAPAAPPTGGPAFTHQQVPTPLPFDPKSLKGLSERLIGSHWENNYGGAVKALNALRGRLAQALADPNVPAYVYTGLKREQLLRTGSVVYHDLYFGGLGGNGQADGGTRSLLARHFGSFDAWETEFRRIGNGLAGGSGWVLLAWNPTLKVLENSWLADHGNGVTGSTPILVMDMYEHAFQMDYGAAAAKYIDAYMANVNWDVVAARLKALPAA